MSRARGSSLDLGKNNSTSPESRENGQSDGSDRYDCRHVYANLFFELADEDYDPERDDEERPRAPYRCGSWECYCCGYRMRQNLVEEIKRITSQRPEMSRLLTLTLDPDNIESTDKEPHKYITERWNALRTRLKREIGDFSFIWVREEQENGNPHLHAIVSRYLPQEAVSAAWDDLGGGEVVDIRKIDRTDKAAHYVGKYLTKHALSGLPDGIQRYNSSSDIDLDVRGDGETSEETWQLRMNDYVVTRIDGGEPLKREVENMDFVQQREWGAPVPPDPPD